MKDYTGQYELRSHNATTLMQLHDNHARRCLGFGYLSYVT